MLYRLQPSDVYVQLAVADAPVNYKPSPGTTAYKISPSRQRDIQDVLRDVKRRGGQLSLHAL